MLRFAAIMCVVLGHSKILLPEPYQPIVDNFILDGVSIFFVLSGYLIGGILIRICLKEEFTFSKLIHFWKRRWLRTLPVYLVILIFLAVFYFFFLPRRFPDELWRYFVFLQNFGVKQAAFFGESWSLSIEEWFYLLIPFSLLFLLKSKLFTVKSAVLILSIVVIILVVWYRNHLYFQLESPSYASFDTFIFKQVIPRLDALMFGVLAIWVQLFLPKIEKKTAGLLFITGVVLLYFVKFRLSHEIDLLSFHLAPLLKSLGVVLLLPVLSSWKTCRFRFAKWITFISLISYSLYLVNRTIVIDLIIKLGIHENAYKSHVLSIFWVVDYVLFWVISIVLSWILYVRIEKPFMKLRK